MKHRVVVGIVALAGTIVLASTPAARAARPTPSAPSCGTAVLKADGKAWTCTFADNFDGTALDRTKWMAQTNFASGDSTARACYLDDPSTIGVSNGTLNLTLRKLGSPVTCKVGASTYTTPYVAGSVMSYRLFSQQYGRFEARIKNNASTAPGLQEAFWLWPDDRYSTGVWPAAGEIDIAETYSYLPNNVIPFLHYNDGIYGPNPGVNTAWNCYAPRGVYNTYTLEWTATRLEIFVNGKSCLVNTSGDQAFQKPYIMALTQLMGMADNALTSATTIPATMNVDYVRVWK